MPPVPCGPRRLLCPVKISTSAFQHPLPPAYSRRFGTHPPPEDIPFSSRYPRSPHGLNCSGHVGAVAYDHCSFSGWQLRQCRHFHISLPVAGQNPGPFPQAGKIPQRPQKTVMLGLSHIDPTVRPVHSPKKQIGALRRPGGEKDPIPSLHSKKPAQTPPAGFHNVFFFRLQTASHLPVRHALCISDERIDHTLRFRPEVAALFR